MSLKNLDDKCNANEAKKSKQVFLWLLKTFEKNILSCFLSGPREFWLFDSRWNLVKWIKNDCGFVQKWKFWTFKWSGGEFNVLLEWKQKTQDWSVKDWKFDKYWRFIEWKSYDVWNGVYREWKFSSETWCLFKWQVTYWDWSKKIIWESN